MSSAQGPRGAGMQASANDASRREHGMAFGATHSQAAVMSSAQGPRGAGMQASANDASRREHGMAFGATHSQAAVMSWESGAPAKLSASGERRQR